MREVKASVAKKLANLNRLFDFMKKGRVVDKELLSVCGLTRIDTDDFPNFKDYNENRSLFKNSDDKLKEVDLYEAYLDELD